MANYNKVILVGNLTRDPQVSYLPSQMAVAEFGIAVNRKWKDAQGQQRDEACFIDCRAYGKQAEILSQYVKKGSPLMLDGRLQFATWEGKDGQKHSKHRVVVENFQFLGQGQGQGQGQPGQAPRSGGYRPAQAPSAPPPSEPMEEPAPPQEDFNQGGGEDTIPF